MVNKEHAFGAIVIGVHKSRVVTLSRKAEGHMIPLIVAHESGANVAIDVAHAVDCVESAMTTIVTCVLAREVEIRTSDALRREDTHIVAASGSEPTIGHKEPVAAIAVLDVGGLARHMSSARHLDAHIGVRGGVFCRAVGQIVGVCIIAQTRAGIEAKHIEATEP